jgi:hypothetical protein
MDFPGVNVVDDIVSVVFANSGKSRSWCGVSVGSVGNLYTVHSGSKGIASLGVDGSMFSDDDVGKLHGTFAERLLLSNLVILSNSEPSKFARSPLCHIGYTELNEPDE